MDPDRVHRWERQHRRIVDLKVLLERVSYDGRFYPDQLDGPWLDD